MRQGLSVHGRSDVLMSPQIAWYILMAMYVLNLVLVPFTIGRPREPVSPVAGVFLCCWTLILICLFWTLKP
jgi:hypothetical protein